MENGLSQNRCNTNEIESTIMNNKRIKLPNNHHIDLHLKIFGAEGIDEPSLHAFVVNRAYRVMLWVRPGEEHFTNIVNDNNFQNPIWNTKITICLGEYPHNYEFLNLEFLRFKSLKDPGTSSGIIVVRSARIYTVAKGS